MTFANSTCDRCNTKVKNDGVDSGICRECGNFVCSECTEAVLENLVGRVCNSCMEIFIDCKEIVERITNFMQNEIRVNIDDPSLTDYNKGLRRGRYDTAALVMRILEGEQ